MSALEWWLLSVSVLVAAIIFCSVLLARATLRVRRRRASHVCMVKAHYARSSQ